MEKQLQLVGFEQAKKLKKLGFNWECNDLYFGDDKSLSDDYDLYDHNSTKIDDEWTCEVFSAPTVALALKWFRDEKEIFAVVELKLEYEEDENHHYEWSPRFELVITRNNIDILSIFDLFNTYEAAESALLDKLLKLEL